MQEKLHIQFSPTRLKQMKKIALSGSRSKLKILNGKLEEGFQLLKSTAQKFKSFATDLADRIPQTLAARISLNLFAHFESKSSKRLRIPKGIVLGGVLALMAALPAMGQTINVANTNDTGVGSLRQAILDANANPIDGVIRLANGTTYTIASNLPIVTGTDVGGTLSIISTGTLNAIIDGNNLHRPLTMTSGSNLTLSKITIQNGSANKGGAIYNKYGDLTISDCLITQNESTAGSGGGIFNRTSSKAISVLIENSTLSFNSSSSTGGGLYSSGNISSNVSNSTISNNSTASSGGGIRNTGSTSSLSISSSTISGNIAGSAGGGIYNNSGNVSISSSSITGNRGISHSAGGVSSAFFSSLTIQASTIANNQTDGNAGGIATWGGFRPGTTTIKNCTISGNSAVKEGGGFFKSTNPSQADNVIIQQSTFSNNAGATHGGAFIQGQTSITLQNNIFANSTGRDFSINTGTTTLTLVTATIAEDGTLVHANASSGDPLLGALTLNSGFLIHPLQTGSPALGAGANISIATDQVGNARVLANPDIGAVEVLESVATVSCPIDVTTNADSGVGSLRQAILDANSNISDCVIYLDGGETYTLSSNLPIVTGTDVGGTLSIISTGTLNAIIDGNNAHRPLTMTSGSNLTLSKITIQNGSANKGGGIYNKYGDLTISDCLITQNESTAGSGGGIFNRSSNKAVSVFIENSTLSFNSSSSTGGGLYSSGNISSNVSNSTISNNSTASNGGGIRNTGSTSSLSISNSTISGNVAGSSGGGIYNTSGNVSISSSSITGNRGISHSAGGLNSAFFSTLNIQASTIANNQTDGFAGGISIFSGAQDATTILRNCTISGNTALGEAGGIHIQRNSNLNDITLQHTTISNNSGATHGGLVTANQTTVTFQNSIIANSTGNDFELGAGGTLTLVTASIVEDGTMAGASAIDPLLGALTLNSGFLIHPLQTGSPALGAGANISIGTDQVGNARVLANPDIGAVEITEVSGACMVITAPAGVTNTWIGCTNSDWNTATNWSTGAVPTASDVVYVPVAAANELIIDEVATCAKMIVQIGAKCLINYNAGGRLQIKF